MTIELDIEEIVFIYGRLKRELTNMESAKGIKISKSEFKFYENLLAKLENSYPSLTKLPL